MKKYIVTTIEYFANDSRYLILANDLYFKNLKDTFGSVINKTEIISVGVNPNVIDKKSFMIFDQLTESDLVLELWDRVDAETDFVQEFSDKEFSELETESIAKNLSLYYTEVYHNGVTLKFSDKYSNGETSFIF